MTKQEKIDEAVKLCNAAFESYRKPKEVSGMRRKEYTAYGTKYSVLVWR